MKTAVSLPDGLYEEAEKTAQSLGIPRSQLFAKALEEFIEQHKRENVTDRLNAVYSKAVYSKTGLTDGEEVSNTAVEALRNLTKNDTW